MYLGKSKVPKEQISANPINNPNNDERYNDKMMHRCNILTTFLPIKQARLLCTLNRHDDKTI